MDLGAAGWRLLGTGLTSSGKALGTLDYMAPEVLNQGAPADERADVWSVGVVLYELLSGQNPFSRGQRGISSFVVGKRIVELAHAPLLEAAPHCPPALAAIVDRALSKAPGDRHRSARELGDALAAAFEAYVREHPVGPLAELVARVCPEGARRAAEDDQSRLRRQDITEPLGLGARPSPPTAPPIEATLKMGGAEVDAAEAPVPETVPDPARYLPPPAEGAERLSISSVPEPRPEVLRVSDVVLRSEGAVVRTGVRRRRGRRAVIGGTVAVVVAGACVAWALLDDEPEPASPGARGAAPPSASAAATPRPVPGARP